MHAIRPEQRCSGFAGLELARTRAMQRTSDLVNSRVQRAREEGFDAGLAFSSLCPYFPGTEEAREWELGWLEAVLKRSGVARRRRVGRTRRKLKKLLGRLVGP